MTCAQGWTWKKLILDHAKGIHRIGCICVGDGPIAGGPQQLPHRRRVTAATYLGLLDIHQVDCVKLHSGILQMLLHVRKILKSKEYEG